MKINSDDRKYVAENNNKIQSKRTQVRPADKDIPRGKKKQDQATLTHYSHFCPHLISTDSYTHLTYSTNAPIQWHMEQLKRGPEPCKILIMPRAAG